jgi:hypothetical protein
MSMEVTVATALDPNVENHGDEKQRKRTLGSVRLMHHDTKALILVPTPTSDPDDPLNWYGPILVAPGLGVL